MTSSGDSEREDDSPSRSINLPFKRHQVRTEDDHAGNKDDRNEESGPEALEDLRHFLEEVGALDLFLRRGPGDVVREEMGEDGDGEVDGETAEEEEAARREV